MRGKSSTLDNLGWSWWVIVHYCD